jgi:hypothetical protein
MIYIGHSSLSPMWTNTIAIYTLGMNLL